MQSKKFQKKSHSAEKSGAKVGSLEPCQGSGRVLFLVGAFSLKEKSPTLTVSSFFFFFFFCFFQLTISL